MLGEELRENGRTKMKLYQKLLTLIAAAILVTVLGYRKRDDLPTITLYGECINQRLSDETWNWSCSFRPIVERNYYHDGLWIPNSVCPKCLGEIFWTLDKSDIYDEELEEN